MIRKTIQSALVLGVLAAGISPSYGSAAETKVLYEGKLSDSRMLIPLRSVSQELGAVVNWNQQLRTITIAKGDTQVKLVVGSRDAQVDGAKATLDVPPQVAKGVTYVPVRFLSQALGADLAWDQADKSARVILDDRRVLIRLAPVEPYPDDGVEAPRLTEQRVRALMQQANEATDLSPYKQIRTHFGPYFTDRFINRIVRERGLEYDYRFRIDPKEPVMYIAGNKATVFQSSEFDDGRYKNDDSFLTRNLVLVYTNGQWLVDDMVFRLEGRRV